MYKKIIKTTFILAILFTMQAPLSGAGLSSAGFLEMMPFGRTMAMSGSISAIAEDSSFLLFNPASLAGITKNEAWVSYMKYIVDFNYDTVVYGHKFEFGNMAFNASFFSSPSFEDSDLNGKIIGQVKNGDFLFSAGYGKRITLSSSSILDWGAGIETIYSVLSTYSGTSAALNTGAIYRTFLFKDSESGQPRNFSAGVSMQNLGLPLKYSGVSAPLPLKFRMGAGYRSIQLHDHGLLTALNFEYATSGAYTLSAGLEYGFREMLFVRAGYGFTNGPGAISLGIGGSYLLNAIRGFFDFAYAPTNIFGNVYTFTLGTKF